MQQPTLRNVRIRSTRDAIAVFHGVARDTLPLITRRLDAEERLCITAGTVFVWEENANSEASGLGMERWTDGMGWGPSRVRDARISVLPPERIGSGRRNGQSSNALGADDTKILVVALTSLAAYFSQETLSELDTIDDLQLLDVPIPEGWFRSARASKTTRRENRALDVPEPTELNSPHSLSKPLQATQTRYRSRISPTSSSLIAMPIPIKPATPSPLTMMGQLVPLEYLENRPQRNRRHPTDEQLLRRFV
ncbi:hypothetical protein MIND_01367100 [Mycena indigotica]|uniref:Uncharacterized protein n=1 Tax=Mycena indigotica TaxID=2126181 RepID=A0A8H6VS19_9AGAR|nr:uncharacterized protein MIND_01367100 [Mycena indigotica]KAF7289921.1 hypothetical protein MIND_01367100 [Mycena indigotica]